MKSLIIPLILTITVGCSILNSEEEDITLNPITNEVGLEVLSKEDGIDILNTNRQKWNAIDSANYNFIYQRLAQAGGFGYYKMIVVDNKVTAVLDPETNKTAYFIDTDGTEVPIFERYTTQPWINTVDDLFNEIENKIKTADEVRVKFDEQLGYPTSIYIDQLKSFIDDEHGHSIKELVIQ